MRFRRAAAQIAGKVPAIADEVPEGSGTHSKQSSGGFRYKNLPRSSKLLGITHGFIFFSPGTRIGTPNWDHFWCRDGRPEGAAMRVLRHTDGFHARLEALYQ